MSRPALLTELLVTIKAAGSLWCRWPVSRLPVGTIIVVFYVHVQLIRRCQKCEDEFITCRNGLFLTWRSRWQTDGLNTLDSSKYRVIERKLTELYTTISVDIGQPPAAQPDVRNVTHESLAWYSTKFVDFVLSDVF